MDSCKPLIRRWLAANPWPAGGCAASDSAPQLLDFEVFNCPHSGRTRLFGRLRAPHGMRGGRAAGRRQGGGRRRPVFAPEAPSGNRTAIETARCDGTSQGCHASRKFSGNPIRLFRKPRRAPSRARAKGPDEPGATRVGVGNVGRSAYGGWKRGALHEHDSGVR